MRNGGALKTWRVVLRNQSRSLVIYNSDLQQIRTVSQPNSPESVEVPAIWTSPKYFQILADHFRGCPSLPLSLSDFLMNGYFDKFFSIRQKIGSGGCGSVYRVEHQLAGIQLAVYACKVITVGEFSWLQRVINEVRLLEKLSKVPHPLICGYKHCWIEEWQPANFGPRIPCLFILMEYAPLGNLEHMISSKTEGIFKKINEDEVWQIFINIAIAVQHLHSFGIIHRDLKLSNVLIFEELNNHPLPIRLALSDFGTALDLNSLHNMNNPHGFHAAFKRSGATGTVETMAPELFIKDDFGNFLFSHTFSSDIWSLGVILFSLFFRINPFCSVGEGGEGEQRLKNFTNVDDLIKDLKLNICAPLLAMKIIKKCMVLDPKERCTIDDILNDPKIFDKISDLGLNNLIKNDLQRPFVVSPSTGDLNSSLPLDEKNDETCGDTASTDNDNSTCISNQNIILNDFLVEKMSKNYKDKNNFFDASFLLITFLVLFSSKSSHDFFLIAFIRAMVYGTLLLLCHRGRIGSSALVFLMFASEMALGMIEASAIRLALLACSLFLIDQRNVKVSNKLALPALMNECIC